MAKFEVTSCSVDDGPAIAKVNVSAFWTDPTWVVIWRGKTLEYVIAQYGRKMPYALLKNRARCRHQKVIDTETGIVAGYARWTFPEFDTDNLDYNSIWPVAQVPTVTSDREQQAKEDDAAADYNYDRSLDELDQPLDEIMDRLKNEKPYIVLNIVAVHPDNWRKGIATMLVESGIREIESLRLPVDLNILVRAKKAGLGIYRRAGFEVVDHLVQDASKFGVEGGEYGAYFLTRPVKRRETFARRE